MRAPVPAVLRRRLDGMRGTAAVDRAQGWAFLAIPKAANTAVKLSLLGPRGLTPRATVDGVRAKDLVHRDRGGLYAREGLRRIAEDPPELVFTAVRDPWSRILSCWKDKVMQVPSEPLRHYGVRRGDSLERFCEIVAEVPDREANVHFRSQEALLTWEGRFLPGLVLRADDLSAGWAALEAHFAARGLPAPSPPRRSNVSPAALSDVRHTPRSVSLVAERYAADIARFGFAPPDA